MFYKITETHHVLVFHCRSGISLTLPTYRCGPCKVIAPVFEQLASTHASPNRFAFAKVDTDRNSDIVRQFGVSAMPTFLIIKNGSVTETIRGANASELRSAVAKAASEATRGPASTGKAFEGAGRRLGGAGESGAARGGAGGFAMPQLTGLPDTALRFAGLYFTTLFSLDAYGAANDSPFKAPGTPKSR